MKKKTKDRFFQTLMTSILSMSAVATADPVSFTSQQAEAGEWVYQQACLPCHQPTGGSGVIPVLVDDSFKTRWAGRPLSDLFAAVKRMPPGTPLDDDNYANITAYLLKTHGIASGDTPLPADTKALASMALPASKDSVDTHTVKGDPRHPLLASLSPVTPELLANPPAGDWLSFGRTNEKAGFSPLRDINRKTIDQLAPSWDLKLAAGTNNPTPLIHDGVMFFYTFPDTVMALNATNGILLWRYRHEPVGVASSRKMGIALGGDKVFVPTSDMHMLALNMKTGEKAWASKIASQQGAAEPGIDGFSNSISRYDLRAAPIIAAGKVIMGTVSSVVPTGGFIFALDMETGEESWRFRTIAQPGTPGGNSWNGQPAEQRSGGSVWSAASYEPDLGLVYFGIAPTYNVQPFYKPSDDPSQTREAKYTNGTVALDAKTGELRWSYSHHILDHWDLDWAFERQIMDLTIKGKKRRVIATVSKGALLDALDAATGEVVWSQPLTDDPSSSIVSYSVENKQYIALVIGQSNNHHRDWKNYYNRVTEMNQWERPAPIEGSGASIKVFTLEE